MTDAEFPSEFSMSRLGLSAVALFAFAVCGGWSLFGSDDSDKKPAAKPVAQQTHQADTSDSQEPAGPPVSVDAELERAKAMRMQGDYAGATKALAQVMLVDPDNARVVGEYGKALEQQGSSKDAVAFLLRATQLDGSNWTYYSALGVAYDQMDDHKNAKSAYEHALTLKPGEPSVLNNYAVSRMLVGDLDSAQRMLAQAKAAGAANPKVASNLDELMKMRAAKSPAVVASAQGSKPVVAVATAPKHDAAAQKSATQQAAAQQASPKRTVANAAPKSLMPAPVSVADSKQTKAIVAAPPTVVMQAVPNDPFAGPVKSSKSAPAKVAAKSKPKLAAKQVPAKPALPALRTADQGD